MRADVLRGLGDEPASQSLLEWLDGEIARLKAAQRPSDELWLRRERKDPNMPWYRDTYLLVRGCKVVGVVETREDM
jgi:hypothetical protein